MPLVPCPACRRHVRADASACPFCRAARHVAAGLTALALAGCPQSGPPSPPAIYGAPPAPVTSAAPAEPAPDAPPDDEPRGGEVYGAPPPRGG